MITRLSVYFHRLKRWLTRSYWAVRLFRLPKTADPDTSPGLVFIQIDGLSKPQYQRAMENGHLPFLRHLLKRENYKEYSHYSGLPSATPAVQGELFYGIKGCVPAFHFVDRQTQQKYVMYDPKSASDIEKNLAEKSGKPLLEGGSSYSNIFCGGALESHFCAASAGWASVLKLFNPFQWFIIFAFHLDILLRTIGLLILEIFLSLYDSIRGALKGEHFLMELQFILTRVFICVVLREIIVAGVKIDIARGLPIIHLNFFGYDEQSHRRGPDSTFAHWALQGIDDAIRRIWREIHCHSRREYDLWIYSDHGQEHTIPYKREHGEKVEKTISRIFGDAHFSDDAESEYRKCCSTRFPSFLPEAHTKISLKNEPGFQLTGMGPLLHIYPKDVLQPDALKKMAGMVLDQTKIPTAFIPIREGSVEVLTKQGEYQLPQDAVQIFGADHPFLEEVTEDMIALCHHPYAAPVIFGSWLKGEPPRTFPMENGSHAGYGSQETHGFALLPQDISLNLRNKKYIRPLHLREAALQFLGCSDTVVIADEAESGAATTTLRLMTYNVHSCIGMDGKLSPDRIARVIARHRLDAIALQELDLKLLRSGGIDQAAIIARRLQMNYHFQPSFCVEDGKYGNAILSRYPIQIVHLGPLPRLYEKHPFEPRGALWVQLKIHDQHVNLINTHLSIWPKERWAQTQALLGPEWLGSPLCREPTIFCGDFNARPGSMVYREIVKTLKDAQMDLKNHHPHSTWFTHYPFSRIDHVFVSPDIAVNNIVVPRTELDKVASDHIPLVMELEIKIPTGKKEKSERHKKSNTAHKWFLPKSRVNGFSELKD